MTVENLLKKLGINKVGSYSKNGSYIIDLQSSDEFGKIYSKLDKNEQLEYMEDSSTLSIDNSNLSYRYEDLYEISLIADFKYDTYEVVIAEM